MKKDLSLVSAFCDIYGQEVAEHYENGEAWDEAKATRQINRVGPRVTAWESGDDHALPWTLICKNEEPIGTFLAVFNKSKDYPNHFEIACALKSEFWGQQLSLHAGLAYASIFVLPLMDECQGIYATVHPQNEKSRRAMEKHGFEKRGEDYVPSWARESMDPIFKRVNYVLSRIKLIQLLKMLSAPAPQ